MAKSPVVAEIKISEMTTLNMDDMARNYIRFLCKRHSSQKNVADLAAICNGNLSKWLNGKKTLSNESLKKVFDVLGVSLTAIKGEQTAREILDALKAEFSLIEDNEILPFFTLGNIK